MTEIWDLPAKAVFGGKEYPIHGDFRDILDIISRLQDESLPEFLRWQVALALFYQEPIPPEFQEDAMAYLAHFIACGDTRESRSEKLLDWDQDAAEIVADVNKAAGREIRDMPFLHWWTFIAWFHGIGEGRLSTIVGIRRKLRHGEPLEKWEQVFYRENKDRVDLKRRYTAEEIRQRQELEDLLR